MGLGKKAFALMIYPEIERKRVPRTLIKSLVYLQALQSGSNLLLICEKLAKARYRLTSACQGLGLI